MHLKFFPSFCVVRPQASISIDVLSDSSILDLADHPEGWGSGDRVVVASTDFSMHQAEEFTLLPCPTCASNQVKVQGERTSDLQCMQPWDKQFDAAGLKLLEKHLCTMIADFYLLT